MSFTPRHIFGKRYPYCARCMYAEVFRPGIGNVYVQVQNNNTRLCSVRGEISDQKEFFPANNGDEELHCQAHGKKIQEHPPAPWCKMWRKFASVQLMKDAILDAEREFGYDKEDTNPPLIDSSK